MKEAMVTTQGKIISHNCMSGECFRWRIRAKCDEEKGRIRVLCCRKSGSRNEC